MRRSVRWPRRKPDPRRCRHRRETRARPDRSRLSRSARTRTRRGNRRLGQRLDRGVIGLPVAHAGFIGEFDHPPAASAFDERGRQCAECRDRRARPRSSGGGVEARRARRARRGACTNNSRSPLPSPCKRIGSRPAPHSWISEPSRGLGETGVQRRVRAADGRMSGKRNFAGRRKDAQTVTCVGTRRRQQERRLDEIRPRGESPACPHRSSHAHRRRRRADCRRRGGRGTRQVAGSGRFACASDRSRAGVADDSRCLATATPSGCRYLHRVDEGGFQFEPSALPSQSKLS